MCKKKLEGLPITSGDANCDGLVNLLDFEIFRKEFAGESSSIDADFSGDGIVTLADFEIWRQAFVL